MDDASSMKLIKKLTSIAKQVSKKEYKRVDELFELTKEKQYPKVISDLAEAFGMMLVQVEAREFHLARKVEELKKTNTLLKETQDSLIKSEKLKVLGEFVSGIVHEVKNPLQGMLGAAELMQLAEKDEKNTKLITIIREEGERLQELISSILSYAKKRDELQLKKIDVNTFINEKSRLWMSQLAKGSVSLSRKLTQKSQIIMVDPHRLYQVCLNLVLNACDAMPQGGKLTISSGIRKEAETTRVDITFSDTGIGIKEENLKNIFVPLFTTKENGTGLGLSICKEIIEKMQGTIEVSSTLGKGTTFTLSFPAVTG